MSSTIHNNNRTNKINTPPNKKYLLASAWMTLPIPSPPTMQENKHFKKLNPKPTIQIILIKLISNNHSNITTTMLNTPKIASTTPFSKNNVLNSHMSTLISSSLNLTI